MPDLQQRLSLISLQYELALLVGQHLRLIPMLRRFYPQAQKLLACHASHVWLRPPEGTGAAEHRFAYPTREAQDRRLIPTLSAGAEAFAAGGAMHVHIPIEDAGLHAHLLRLPDVGFTALLRRGEPLDTMTVQALEPIFARLATACRASMQHEETERLRVAAVAAGEAKSTFLATMSHEIRTPMHGILGMTSLLLDTKLNRDQAHFANTVRLSAEALLSIINDILDFSKLEAGKLEFEETSFEIAPLLEGLIDILGPRLRDKDIDLSYFIPSSAHGIFRGDSGRLRQVLLNLVGNAVKFTEKGGISVWTEVEPGEGDQVRLKVTVADTGIGIPDSAKDKLFDTFTQADPSTTRLYGGSGLGLAICKRIVDLMHGAIGFESEQGVGSRFWFEVPLKRAAEQPAALMPVYPLERTRILVVDDNAVNREIFRRQFSVWGAAVDVADSAAAGLVSVRTADTGGKPYGVLVLDHLMPGINGMDLAAMLRSDPATAGLPIVMATSSGSADLRAKAMDLRIDRLLMKPVRQTAMLNALMEVLGLGTACTAASDGGGFMPAPPAALPLSILVAEDNAVNRQVAVGLLSRLGHRADVACDGKEAVELVKTGDYDLVLMDLQMPRVDGLAATRMIRALPPPRSETVIVAMTANVMAGDREACINAGMNDFLGKPVDRHKLAHMLEAWSHRLHRLPPEEPEQGAPPPPPQTTGAAPLLDMEQVSALRECLDSQTWLGLVDEFGASAADMVNRLKTASEGSGEQQRIAHSLKGMAVNMGALALSDLAHDIEKGSAERRRHALDGLDATFNRTLQLLSSDKGAEAEAGYTS